MSKTNIFEKLMQEIGNIYGVCGLMGNIEAESGTRSDNAQNSYMTKMGLTDAQYTQMVDDGSYTDFCIDRIGYGLCQWTSSGRKTGLYNHAKSTGRSISDENMQIEWMLHELKTSYKNVLEVLKNAVSIKEASDIVVLKYERPASVGADASESTRQKTLDKRQEMGEAVFKEFYKVENEGKGVEIKKILLTNNDCYKANKRITPSGIIVHSTGANNKTLKRYIAPDDGIIGKNIYNNHWNKSGIEKCVHAFIGVDDSGKVRVYQTLPFDFRCWGCGKGKSGTYNDYYIQFEICEDALNDEKYFNEVFSAAADLCAYCMQLYPNIKINDVISHHEAYLRGMGSNHKDCDHWLAKFGKNMDWLRDLVSARLAGSAAEPEATKPEATKPEATGFPYRVKVTTLVLNVRAGAGTEFKKTTSVKMNEVYTIVDEKMNGSTKWGKLKSGAGWISLKYTKRV